MSLVDIENLRIAKVELIEGGEVVKTYDPETYDPKEALADLQALSRGITIDHRGIVPGDHQALVHPVTSSTGLEAIRYRKA